MCIRDRQSLPCTAQRSMAVLGISENLARRRARQPQTTLQEEGRVAVEAGQEVGGRRPVHQGAHDALVLPLA
eukprot:14654289-Alexandrium_andersonii.AAC.1